MTTGLVLWRIDFLAASAARKRQIPLLDPNEQALIEISKYYFRVRICSDNKPLNPKTRVAKINALLRES